MTHLSKSVALHYATEGYGMRCNTIHPGVMRTPILDKVMAQVEDPEALYAKWVSIHPLGRLGKPEEIASMALYLASDEARFITGGEFVVDGGSSL
jgi:NAD(P)-dependent dehydrogenase (short-subunit alcohol dehydrogenase family)